MLTCMSTGRIGVRSRSGHDLLGNLDLHAFRAAATHSGQAYLRTSKSQFLAKSTGSRHPCDWRRDVASALLCTFLVGEALQRAQAVNAIVRADVPLLYQAYYAPRHPIVCLPHRLQAMG